MAPDSLNKLTIDKSRQTPAAALKGKRMRAIVILVLLLVAVAIVVFSRGRSISIETTTVSQVYPSQSFTLLNASGYVVAQRKAAVASKITGRLEWLGVEEGSRVSSGQVIARLENLDLAAVVRQAEASVQIAKASLEQARAEMTDADQSYKRMKVLLKQGIVFPRPILMPARHVTNAPVPGCPGPKPVCATLQRPCGVPLCPLTTARSVLRLMPSC